jgi:thiamine kinase-like enzyme
MAVSKWDFQKRETLYRGMNGRTVERVHLTQEESRILKPYTYNSVEIWVYENIFPAFPPVYPRILDHLPATAINEEGWLLFEDLGNLEHEYREDWAQEVIRLMAWWHTLPIETVQSAPLHGLKPTYPEMVADLLAAKIDLQELAPTYEINSAIIHDFFDRITREGLSSERVLSHGDLHVGNYSFAHGQLFILDWEHTHLNNRYWDLYHLIDLSHPLYPKKDKRSWRNRLLDSYIEEATRHGSLIDPQCFIYEYHLFASVFSLWMLRLIEADRTSGNSPWSEEQLSAQAIETATTFLQTVDPGTLRL